VKNFIGTSTKEFFEPNFSSVNDTAETISAVSLTHAETISAVSMTLPNDFRGVNDTAETISAVDG
jgi:hypothetical protein